MCLISSTMAIIQLFDKKKCYQTFLRFVLGPFFVCSFGGEVAWSAWRDGLGHHPGVLKCDLKL
jgi:hypothetical protein